MQNRLIIEGHSKHNRRQRRKLAGVIVSARSLSVACATGFWLHNRANKQQKINRASSVSNLCSVSTVRQELYTGDIVVGKGGRGKIRQDGTVIIIIIISNY